MSDEDPADDPWMTVAEFAAEMRARPVTVRSWIAKGQLRATRAGQRKWLVRRSELTRMLEQGDGPHASPLPPPRPRAERSILDEYPPEVLQQIVDEAAADALVQLEQDDAMAAYDWALALEQSRFAPPNARFASRIRDIATAAAVRAATIRERMHETGFAWTSVPDSAGMTLSYELRPGGIRPGPKDAWERFDRVVTRLGAAMEDTSASAVASAFSDLASAMNDVADAIENRSAQARRERAADQLDDPGDAQ
jgi:excisionase family DNA binding protein